MKNVTNTNPQAQSGNGYYDGVLYARVFLNEVKMIPPKSKKAKAYCAINATIIVSDENGKKTYTNIDLIVCGEKAKQPLREVRAQWPKSRFDKTGDRWIADVNIGSIGTKPYINKKGQADAVLSGRLVNIRALKIGQEVVFGEMDDEIPAPNLITPAYVNLVDVQKGVAEVALLDGKIGEHNTQFTKVSFKDIEVFEEMDAKGLCPRGYEHRATNPKVFAMIALSHVEAIAYKNKQDEVKSYLNGTLQDVRYLKANDEVLTQKSAVQKFAKGFKEGWTETRA